MSSVAFAELITPLSGAQAFEAPALDIRLVPKLEQVSVVRMFLEEYLRSTAANADLLARVTVAAHELLENAAKYSAEPGAHLRVGIETEGDKRCAWVEVSNVGAPEHVDDLIMTIEELADPATAVEMYQVDMICSALKGDASGLGLARIRAELEMELGLKVQGRTVCIIAKAMSENT